MENFIFISPDFPKNYDQFVRALKNVGFNVLGIGATPYHEISSSLKDNLTEYYYCPDLADYE
ncbi:MAG TPA: carbamoylphosphate synthase large subunit, partial [Bacilli bacterium]|nr:carbamoylphosphate synthase large subunit [Bacilli bacterium]